MPATGTPSPTPSPARPAHHKAGPLARYLAPSPVADALFSPVQIRVLALLFGQPRRVFRGAEIYHAVQGGSGAVHRQLRRLAAARLVTVTRLGAQRRYRANRDNPAVADLHALVTRTLTFPIAIRRALAPLAPRIDAAFIAGAAASGATRPANAPIDLVVVAQRLDYLELVSALDPLERRLGRRITRTLVRPAAWHRTVLAADPEDRWMLDLPRIVLMGRATAFPGFASGHVARE